MQREGYRRMDSYGNELREPKAHKPKRRKKKRKPNPPQPALRTSVQYRRYMESKAWATKRKHILAQRGSACYACGSQRKPCLHHRTYERLGDELPQDLIVLCEFCHNEAHRLIKQGVVKLDVAHDYMRQQCRPNA